MACALLCEELATACFLPKDPCYTAGLLHDVGRLALLASFPSDYANALDLADRYQLDVRECERGVFGMDHCEAGQWLVEEWGFPEEFRAITGRHHQPPPEGRFDKIALVQFCCRTAEALGFMIAGLEPHDGIVPSWSRLPVAPWYRFPSEAELSLTIGGRINALECNLLN
jgi:HD-like signal output (HDOD) protein